jgi:hypothetical protein
MAKKKYTPTAAERRRLRAQQVIFTVIALLMIITMVASLTMR